MGELAQELKSNSDVYNPRMSIKNILEFLTLHERMYIDHSTAREVIELVLDFMSYCKKQCGAKQELKTPFTIKYPEQIAAAWKKIREPTYFANKGHLRVLSYIVGGAPNVFEAHFGELEFDLSYS